QVPRTDVRPPRPRHARASTSVTRRTNIWPDARVAMGSAPLAEPATHSPAECPAGSHARIRVVGDSPTLRNRCRHSVREWLASCRGAWRAVGPAASRAGPRVPRAPGSAGQPGQRFVSGTPQPIARDRVRFFAAFLAYVGVTWLVRAVAGVEGFFAVS